MHTKFWVLSCVPDRFNRNMLWFILTVRQNIWDACLQHSWNTRNGSLRQIKGKIYFVWNATVYFSRCRRTASWAKSIHHCSILADHLFYYIDNISKLSLWDQNWSLKYCSVCNRKMWKQKENSANTWAKPLLLDNIR